MIRLGVDAASGSHATEPSSAPRPRVVIAAPLYEKAEFLRPAVESLLVQTYRDFRLVLVDDASTDATPEIAQELAADDARVSYVRNERRLGLIDTWRRGFELARERHPSIEYFAWGSDHDRWHPDWLRTLVEELDAHPEAVLAYPMSVRISGTGEAIREAWEFDTAGIASPRRRLRATYRGISSGSIVYGLFRADALERAGVYRHVLSPDRLVLTELALQGEFRQAKQVLWERRFWGVHTMRRQRAGSFPYGAPWYTRLPICSTHVATVFWLYGVRGIGRPEIGRPRGVVLALNLLRMIVVFESGRRRRKLRKFLLKRMRGLRALLLAVTNPQEHKRRRQKERRKAEQRARARV
jgi:glycosyltransferase involved in cell wall biosynthesis